MKKIVLFILAILAFSYSLMQTAESKEDNITKFKARLKKPDVIDYKFIEGGNWRYVMSSNGTFFYDANDNDGDGNTAGGEFPRGSGTTLLYMGGLWIGTKRDGVPVCSQSWFSTEFQPGRITNSGMPVEELLAEPDSIPEARVYQIGRFSQNDDYFNWPEDALHDRQGLPALIADQQTWVVFNDLDTALVFNNGYPPAPRLGKVLGVQVTLESYVFNLPFARDAVFLKCIIDNKSNTNYDSVYFGIFMDADVINSSSDIAGSDSIRGIGYVYDARDEDLNAAAAVDLLQGPVVSIADISNDLYQRFAQNQKILNYDPVNNGYHAISLPAGQFFLGATAFARSLKHNGPRSDTETLFYLQGRDRNGALKAGAGYNYKFAFPGNPLTQQGSPDVAGISDAHDEHVMLATGPFKIASEGKQEIWFAITAATANNRLEAVRQLFDTDDKIQSFFDKAIAAGQYYPPVPITQVTSMDSAVLIEWKDNAEFVIDRTGEALGITRANGFSADYIGDDFQGYRIYKSRTGLENSFTMIAQYDKIDTFGTVHHMTLNTNGFLELEDINLGSNTGLPDYFVDTDVKNGQQYFYSVTAYDAQPSIGGPDSILFYGRYILKPTNMPVSFESSIYTNVFSAVPMHAIPGMNTMARLDSTGILHQSGISDAMPRAYIVNPVEVKNETYRIEFCEIPSYIRDKPLIGLTPGDLVMQIRKDSDNELVEFSSHADNPNTFLDGNGNGILDSDANGNLIADDERFDDRYFVSLEPFKTYSARFDGIDIYISDEIYLNSFYEPTLQYAARWFRGSSAKYSGVEFAGYLGGTTLKIPNLKAIDLVFSRDPAKWQIAYGHDVFKGIQNKTFPVPFQLFEVDAKDGDPAPKAINAVVLDSAGLNGWFLDNSSAVSDGSGPARGNYIYAVLTDYDGGSGSLLGKSVDQLPCAFALRFSPLDFFSSNTSMIDGADWNNLLKAAYADFVLTPDERDSIYRQIPDEGTFHIIPPYVLTTQDTFLFKTVSSVSPKPSLKDLKLIRVVPNPFYKFSSYQTTPDDKLIKFTNLPGNCTIKIFTVAGDLVKTIYHNATSDNDRVNPLPYKSMEDFAPNETSIELWNVRNHRGKLVASGMYIALIEAPGIGKTTVKFAVIQ
ncbi:hypothetical protein HUU42_07630 [bacterium]|nr:hypothetical protein [bacterium]